MLEKDEAEHPVPERLRPVFRKIADAFVEGDYILRSHPIEGVKPVDPEVAELIEYNVTAYGDALLRLTTKPGFGPSINGIAAIGLSLSISRPGTSRPAT